MIRQKLLLTVLFLNILACFADGDAMPPDAEAGAGLKSGILAQKYAPDIPRWMCDAAESRFEREKEKGYIYIRGFDGLLRGRYPLTLETEVPRGYISLPGYNEEDTVRILKESCISIKCEDCPLDDFCELLSAALREIETPMIVQCDIHPSWLGTEEVPRDRTFAGIFENEWIRKEIKLPTVTLDVKEWSAYDVIGELAGQLKDIITIQTEDYRILVWLIRRRMKNVDVKFFIE